MTKYLFLFLLIACSNRPELPPSTDRLHHELRKFNVKNTVSGHSSAWYFLVAGGYSSGTTQQTKVRFYFKNCYGEYQFLELPLHQVKIKTDSVLNKVPFVTFSTVPEHGCTQVKYEWQVDYVTIHCRESDFQPEININDLR